MVDKSADSTHEIDVVPTQVSARRFRWKAGAFIVAAGVIAIWGMTQTIPDQTFRIIGIYYGVVVWAVGRPNLVAVLFRCSPGNTMGVFDGSRCLQPWHLVWTR